MTKDKRVTEEVNAMTLRHELSFLALLTATGTHGDLTNW